MGYTDIILIQESLSNYHIIVLGQIFPRLPKGQGHFKGVDTGGQIRTLHQLVRLTTGYETVSYVTLITITPCPFPSSEATDKVLSLTLQCPLNTSVTTLTIFYSVSMSVLGLQELLT